jgi:hypothetical protein
MSSFGIFHLAARLRTLPLQLSFVERLSDASLDILLLRGSGWSFSYSTRYRDRVSASATRDASASRFLSPRTARKFPAIFRMMYSPISAQAATAATATQFQKESQAGTDAGASTHRSE